MSSSLQGCGPLSVVKKRTGWDGGLQIKLVLDLHRRFPSNQERKRMNHPATVAVPMKINSSFIFFNLLYFDFRRNSHFFQALRVQVNQRFLKAVKLFHNFLPYTNSEKNLTKNHSAAAIPATQQIASKCSGFMGGRSNRNSPPPGSFRLIFITPPCLLNRRMIQCPRGPVGVFNRSPQPSSVVVTLAGASLFNRTPFLLPREIFC